VTLLKAEPDRSRLRLAFGEGRNREVKRYCQALGHPVRRLVRVEFGPLRLGRLAPGQSRPLTGREVAALRRLRRPQTSPIIRGLLTESHQELL
jgi:23S rRNA pseudouridine2605 synthase